MIYRNVEIYNVHELLESEDGQGSVFTRIPNDLRLKLNDSAKVSALQTAGCEFRFNLKSDMAKVVLKSTAEPSIVEVYQGCFAKTVWYIVGPEPTEIPVAIPENIEVLKRLTRENQLPFDAGLTRVMLPWNPAARLIDIEGDFELPRPEQTPPRKCLCYGSSITHGFRTIRPTGSYAQRMTQFLGVDLINLGFGGGAHLEREMAEYVAGRTNWDFATLEMGINLIGGIDVEEFARRVDVFLTTIAQSHPDNWVLCMDLFTCRWDVSGDSKVGAFRKVVRDKIKQLHMPKLVYVPGYEILTSVSGLTIDLVHPSPQGMEEMAVNLSRLIRGKMAAEY